MVDITIALAIWLAALHPAVAAAQPNDRADVVLHQITVTPAAPRQGQAATVATSLARRDAGRRPVEYIVRFRVEGTLRPFAERRVTLAPGQTQRVAVPWRAGAGRQTVEATALAARSRAAVAHAERLVVVAPAAEAPPAPAAQADAPRREPPPALRVAATAPLVVRSASPRVVATAPLRVHTQAPHTATTEPLRVHSTVDHAATTAPLTVRAGP
ncbi:MAG: hypothetical protein JNL66_11935 [Alphaproteobacteria bacterium]|nr:hypothetical protein [Alphaproteobacteria bacterium]